MNQGNYSFMIVEFGSPEHQQTIDLRTEVLRIPLGLVFTEEQLTAEWDSVHMGIFDEEGFCIACCILKAGEEEVCHMRQVAVKPDLQGSGIGKKLVKYFEELARKRGFKRVELHARKVAVPFYERLEYLTYGEEFVEVNIPHFAMGKDL